MPLLFVCEDNGLGISVSTPPGWVVRRLGEPCAGQRTSTPTGATWQRRTTLRARRRSTCAGAGDRRSCTWTPSGSWATRAATPRSPTARRVAIAADYVRDPLLGTARLLAAGGILAPDEILARYEAIARAGAGDGGARHRRAAARARRAVMRPARATPTASRGPGRRPRRRRRRRQRAFGGRLPEDEGALTLGRADQPRARRPARTGPEMLVFGEDVARQGRRLRRDARAARAGSVPARVFDTLLDEQSILGLALGARVSGLAADPGDPVPRLPAQRRGPDPRRGRDAAVLLQRASTATRWSCAIAGYGYQKGFGGHFHNDDAVAVLRDIPGLVVASPARPDDAAAMLRTCCRGGLTTARSACSSSRSRSTTPVTCTSQATGSGWRRTHRRSSGPSHVPVGRGRTHGDGDGPDARHLRQRAAHVACGSRAGWRARGIRGAGARPALAGAATGRRHRSREATATGRVLVVDETRRTVASPRVCSPPSSTPGSPARSRG